MMILEPRSRTNPRHPGLPLRNIERVEASYARIAGRSRAMALAFYDELFQTMPTLRTLFPRDDLEQRQLALSFVGFVITNLRSVNRLVPLLERMGERGLLRDLSLEELDSIGKILLMVLREYEGPQWTVDTGHAWALAVAWTIAALRRGAAHRHFGQTG